MGEEEARARAQAEKQQRTAARRQQEEERESRLREREERARAIEAENARLREELRAAQVVREAGGLDNVRSRAPSFGEFDPLGAAGASVPPPSVNPNPGQAGASAPPAGDFGNFFEGFRQAFTQSMQDVMVRAASVAYQPPPPPPPPRNNEPTPRNDHRPVLEVLKQKLRPLKVGAADMALELESFFRPIDAYLRLANLDDANNRAQELDRIALLEGTMGDECARALSGVEASQKATYALYKEAIRKRFLTAQEPSHIMHVLRQCAMKPDETTRAFVTRLWAIAVRLTGMPDEWRELEVLTTLRSNHADENVRMLLLKELPTTVAEAERLCEEYAARTQVAPVATKVVAALAAAGASTSQPVDNVNARGGYQGPKARGRGRSRGQQQQGARGGGSNNSSSQSLCYRCNRPGHIARNCTAPSPANSEPRGRGGYGGGRQLTRGGYRPVHNVGAEPYSDYDANRDSYFQRSAGWYPSYLPEFPTAHGAASAYEEGFYAEANEVSEVVPVHARLTYGGGYPHRRFPARMDAATTDTVSPSPDEWWVPVRFPTSDYLVKVDTGARVNVMSVADVARLGYRLSDLKPTTVYLVGFNKAVVRPLGRLCVRVRVNGASFESEFHVVERCNAPLLCLKDAAKAGLVVLAPPAPVAEFNFYKDEIVSLKLKDDAVPKQFPPRKVPLALQEPAQAQLAEMLRDGVIERVTEPSAWCHPMQIAYKPDGRLRICMDPRYLNKFLERAIYPFPSLDQVFSSVKGAKVFSKIDLTWGFWNLRLDEESAKLCTFVTPWGVFRYRRLPFGVSPAPEVFHRVIADVLQGLPGVIHYVDDVLVFGKTMAEHDKRLREVLTRLRRAGFAISDAKCAFRKPAVVFLGHLISGEEIRPDPAKVSVLKSMKPPTNITEHRGLMGFVNFLAQYLPHYSSLTEPLRRLQSSKSHFRWTEDQQKSFELLKDLFAKEPCLVPFDQSLPLSLATDASATGLGAVLLQQGRPVMYTARSLTGAETRYSTIEKELLAVVFALRRCHFYTFGRPVTILTDHRSLLGLMEADLEQMTPQLRRFVERLFPYDLTWQHIPGKDNFIPDYLSRMAPVPPVPADIAEALTFDAADARFTRLLLGGGPFYEEMASRSLDDPVFAFLRKGVQEGWPRRAPASLPAVSSYWPMRFRLRVSGPFLVLDDDRVCVPVVLRARALELLHLGHPGVNGMRDKARRVIYWPGWSADVARHVQGCVPCAAQASAPPRPAYFWEEPPAFPGDHVAADHFAFESECYLVMLDVFSGFPFLYRCASPSATSLLQAAQAVFLQTGLPRVFSSDGGPAFVSTTFQNFLQACGVRHRCSSPQYAQSNGAAERAVRTLKVLRAKCTTPFDLFQSLLEMQNTPRGPCRLSPADVFLGRSQRTWANPCPRAAACSWAAVHTALRHQQEQADTRRPSPGPSSVLQPGTVALLKDFFGHAVHVTVLGPGVAPRAYQVRLPSGRITERNRAFLFPLPRASSTTMTMTSTPPARVLPRTTTMGLSPPTLWTPRVSSSARPAGTAFRSPHTCAMMKTAAASATHQKVALAVLPPVVRAPLTVPAPHRPLVGLGVTPSLVPPPGAPPVPRPPVAALTGMDRRGGNNCGRPRRVVKLTDRARQSAAQGTFRPQNVYRDRLPSSPPPVSLTVNPAAVPHPPTPPGASSLQTPPGTPPSPLARRPSPLRLPPASGLMPSSLQPTLPLRTTPTASLMRFPTPVVPRPSLVTPSPSRLLPVPLGTSMPSLPLSS